MPTFVSQSRVVPTQARPASITDADTYAGAGIEPPLRELLADPIVHAVMRRDRIGPDHVWSAVRAARRALAPVSVTLVHEAPSQVR